MELMNMIRAGFSKVVPRAKSTKFFTLRIFDSKDATATLKFTLQAIKYEYPISSACVALELTVMNYMCHGGLHLECVSVCDAVKNDGEITSL